MNAIADLKARGVHDQIKSSQPQDEKDDQLWVMIKTPEPRGNAHAAYRYHSPEKREDSTDGFVAILNRATREALNRWFHVEVQTTSRDACSAEGSMPTTKA